MLDSYTPMVLVGREREQRLLDHLLDEARAGSSVTVALVGDAGIGKSALLDDAASRAAGMNVLRARGVSSEARIPFAALFELLRPALDHLDQVPRPQREALEGALALRPASAQDRFAVGAATLTLLAAYAEDVPLLVLVDDAHWIDGSTAGALLFAIRRLVADAVAVVLTVRSGEPSLLDEADLPCHTVAGLDRAASTALVWRYAATGATLSDATLERLHRGTGGNPLALIELAGDSSSFGSSLPVEPPLSVGDRVTRVYVERLGALPEAARELLLLAAASDTGDLLTLAKAAAVAEFDVSALAMAETCGLVSVTADRVEFRHPLVRSAVYAAASSDRRREAHRALARVFPDADADRRAWHLALGALGPDAAASSSLEQAGRRARARSAYEVAAQAFERASALAFESGRRASLLYAAADAAWLGGQPGRAVTLLDAARSQSPPADVAASVEHLRGHIAARLGPVDEAQRILLAGADLAMESDRDRAVVMLAEAVNAAFYGADASAMSRAAARIPRLSPDDPARIRFFATMAQGMAMIFGGEGRVATEGARLVRTAVALVEDSDELSEDPRLVAWAAMGPLWLREAEAGDVLIGRALDIARRRSAVGVLPFLLTHVAIDQAAGDRWREAEAGFHEAIHLARETGQRTDLASVLARVALLEARQGKAQQCREHVAESLALAGSIGVGLAEIWALGALGELELGLGAAQEAMAALEAQQAALTAHGVHDPDLSPQPELIELELRLGHTEAAAARVEAYERSATAKGQPWALARAARCRALLAPPDDVDRCFEEAIAWHLRTPDAFETARTRLAYGARLRRLRQRVRARAWLREAIDVFDALGAAPWADIARAELAATGERARRRDLSTRDELTPQELQIAMLLAAGNTTRETAAALFLSPKTIEYHQRSIYRKLDTGTREELAAAFPARTRPGREGDTPGWLSA